MMAKKNSSAPLSTRNFSEELITRIAPRCLDRHFRFLSQDTNISRAKFNREIKFVGKPFNEPCVGTTLCAPQFVIQVANDEPSIAALHQLMKQGNRITSTGDAD